MNTRIKEVRMSLNLNQKEFGDRLGVSRDVISNIELGRVEPKEPFIKLICKEFNISEAWIRTGEGDMSLIDDREDEITKFLGALMKPDNDTEFVKKFIHMLSKLDVNDWKAIEKIALLMTAESKEKD